MEKFLWVTFLIIFGIFISAFITVWKNIKSDGFNRRKFFVDNKWFWAVCLVLAILFSLGICFVEGFEDLINILGFAKYEDTELGLVLLGMALAVTSDKTKISGQKTLNTKVNNNVERKG